jgi:uncharacterized membrane protein
MMSETPAGTVDVGPEAPVTPSASVHATDTQAAKNVKAIASMEQEALHQRSALDRVSDAVTNAAATPWFVVAHVVWFGGWIGINISSARPFDAFPFSLLTLVTSLEAIFLTGFVLMSQNRMTKQADKRAHLDLQVNLLAEQELTAMMGMLRALCERAGVAVTSEEVPVEDLLRTTDIHQIAQAVDEELLQGSDVRTGGAAPRK